MNVLPLYPFATRNLALFLFVNLSLFACRPANNVDTLESESILLAQYHQSQNGNEDSLWMELERELRRLIRTHQVNTGHLFVSNDIEKAGSMESIATQLQALDYLLAEYRLIHGELTADLWDERRRYAQLEKEFDKKSVELQVLQNEMENLEQSINNMQTAITNSQRSNDSLINELNRVYFAYGTANELHEADVVKIRSVWWSNEEQVKMKRNLNTEYFSPADQRQFRLPLCSDAEILTPHSPDSYEIVNDATGALLVITDSEKFWEQSRHLAVKVD